MTFTQEELKEILVKHKKWLDGEKGGERADLTGANLSCADLTGANLSCADIKEANLKGADLTGANLEDVNLRGTNLEVACLKEVNLEWANLRYADLKEAILIRANLERANFEGANLEGANFEGANLRYTKLERANLVGADFVQANLIDSFLDDDEKYRLGVILKEPLIGYKKCGDEKIVTLEIPKGATVYCINGAKCRTNKAKVISISEGTEAVSMFDKNFIYKIGEEIDLSDTFNMAYNKECGSGIHFFKTLEGAADY